MNTQHWLARLSMSFFIVAAVLFWEVYKISIGARGTVPMWRVSVYLVACLLAIVLGVLGIRARHKREE